MAQTFLLMCWLATAGMPTTGTAPLPDELLTERTVAIHRIDLTRIDPADAQTTVAYLLLRKLDSGIAERVEAIPRAIEQFRQAGGREIALIFDVLPAIPGEIQWQGKSVTLIRLQGDRVSETEIAGAVYSLFPWLRPSESQLGKTRRIGSWLVLCEEGSILHTTSPAAPDERLREALSATAGASLSSILVPSPSSTTQPDELLVFEPLMLVMPEAMLFAFMGYNDQITRFEAVWPRIRWISTEVTLGLPPTVNLTMSVPGEATRAELVEIFKDFGWELKLAHTRPGAGAVEAIASTLPDEAGQDDGILQARIVPRRIVIAAIGGAEFSAPNRPRYDECLACGHFREVRIHRGEQQYRLSVFSGPKYGVREPQFCSRLRIVEEAATSRPAEPIHNRASRLVDHDIDAISMPYAVGAVRYDPSADEILLLERPEMGNRRQVLKHMYRVDWRPQRYQGTKDRFSQEAEITHVFQSDEKLMTWDFVNAPLRVNPSPPGMRPRIEYVTTQPGESEFPLPGTGRSEGRGRR